jgi:hypothetical protein
MFSNRRGTARALANPQGALGGHLQVSVGVYFVRLTQGAQVAKARVVVLD